MDYGRVADLPIAIEAVELTQREQETSSGFARTTTVVTLRGEGHVGRGEDVTYDAEDHRALAESGPFPLEGTYTLDSFAETVASTDLFPDGPQRPPSRRYRRWGLESAALDLGLRQAGLDFGEVFERTYDPTRFVVSTALGESPSFDRIARLREVYPDVELKLDPVPAWTAKLIDRLAATDAVRILDLKGQYAHADVHQPATPSLYKRVFGAFPAAIVEDPATSEETRPLLAEHADRLSWDVPVTDVDALESLPHEPQWVNVKPSRIGSVEDLCAVVSYCQDNDIAMYGGGQFELDVGRSQIQALASLFYPDGPNDVAPSAFNDPEIEGGLPESPLDPPEATPGFGTH
ncbi:N-acylamino acid racemase protein [Halorhabdus tiamatea SARL4B]|uniref:N-acylamino acid racemase protein n=1 Tax=Halorhabdus tiamatea SARL4B TaxID=1033806 RepID=F7PIT9_9EURY|nr:hypothetical protein [Halorhabdus tiamatea]ERJ05430.1 N-acylamino acid racemase protein [Halorhabdus tiamatea SARL4B]CCQ33343.1 conserved hypothetical protein [Halorhabdus tiamatea SARL4B]